MRTLESVQPRAKFMSILRVFFFSVNVFRKPKLIDNGLFPLSDCPLPYPLPADLFAYWSMGDAEDMALKLGEEADVSQYSGTETGRTARSSLAMFRLSVDIPGSNVLLDFCSTLLWGGRWAVAVVFMKD